MLGEGECKAKETVMKGGGGEFRVKYKIDCIALTLETGPGASLRVQG